MVRRGRPPETDKLTPFGERLRTLIATSRYVKNRQDMCAQARLDQANLRKYEIDPDKQPPLDWLVAIARVLHVGLDELYPTGFMSQEPPYESWAAFRLTELGRSMTNEERDDLARVRPRHHVPTLEFYVMTLMALRGTPLYPSSSPPSSAPPAPPVDASV